MGSFRHSHRRSYNFYNRFSRFSNRIFPPISLVSYTLSPVASMIIALIFILAIIGTFIYLGVSGIFSSHSLAVAPALVSPQEPVLASAQISGQPPILIPVLTPTPT